MDGEGTIRDGGETRSHRGVDILYVKRELSVRAEFPFGLNDGLRHDTPEWEEASAKTTLGL